MANWVAQLLVVARFCAVACATAALAVYCSTSGSFDGIHVTAVRSSFLVLSCLTPGHAVLLLVQGTGMLCGLAVPLPDDRLLCSLVLAIDGVLGIVSFGTGAAAMSVIQSAGQWRIFVTSPYRAYGVLAVVSGTWAYLTWICEMWLAIGHRLAQQH